MSDYKFMMPWPPTVNHFHQPVVIKGRARCIKGAEARKYEAIAVKLIQSYGLSHEMLSGRLQVKLTLEPPTLRKYDIDNRTKSVFDALSVCGFWEDDEQVDRLIIEKAPKRKNGNVIVEVTKL